MTDQTEREKLLPCLFCGGTKIEVVVDDGRAWKRCKKCGATGPANAKQDDEPEFTWNTRAALDTHDPLCDGCPPADYPHGHTRCMSCPRRALDTAARQRERDLIESIECLLTPGAFGPEFINKKTKPHDLITVRITKAQLQAILAAFNASRKAGG